MRKPDGDVEGSGHSDPIIQHLHHHELLAKHFHESLVCFAFIVYLAAG
jgi:hypothetical protein